MPQVVVAPAQSAPVAAHGASFVGYDTSHRLGALELFLARSKSKPLSYVDALCVVVVREILDDAPALSFDS